MLHHYFWVDHVISRQVWMQKLELKDINKIHFFTFLSWRLGVSLRCCTQSGKWIIASETAKSYIFWDSVPSWSWQGFLKRWGNLSSEAWHYLVQHIWNRQIKCKFSITSERFDKSLTWKALRFATIYKWILSNQDSLKGEFKVLLRITAFLLVI